MPAATGELTVDEWRVRFARLLVERVTATDLRRLGTEELNRLTSRFEWFRVEPEDGYQAITIVNGLVSPSSPDVFLVEGDEGLTDALNAAVEDVRAEIARRLPREHEAAWSRYRQHRRRRPERRDQGTLVALMHRLPRPRERQVRPRSRVHAPRGARAPPSDGADDEPHDLDARRSRTAISCARTG